MKNILMLHTGGTISMQETKETGIVEQSETHPLAGMGNSVLEEIVITEIYPFDLPSPSVQPTNMIELANIINEQEAHYDGFVITHGTDTMEETAYFLNLVLHTSKPVVITGAMRSSNELGTDAFLNVHHAIVAASSNTLNNVGVVVVMNQEIHHSKYVYKHSSVQSSGFQSIYGPIGMIVKDCVYLNQSSIKTETYNIKSISKKVYLLKAYTGFDAEILDALLLTNPDGLVIEAFGQGNLPKTVTNSIQMYIEKGIPVVITSRCLQGFVQPTYGYVGGGKFLKDLGVIMATELSGQKARLKLLIALELDKSKLEIQNIFNQ